MTGFLDNLSYNWLVILAVYMLLAPFTPPHVVEKLRMLKAGTLTRPLDIFDFFFHLTPTALLIAKIVRDLNR